MPNGTVSGRNGRGNNDDRLNGRHCPRDLQERMEEWVDTARMSHAFYAGVRAWCLCYFQLMESPKPEHDADFVSGRWTPARVGRHSERKWNELKRVMIADLEGRGYNEKSILRMASKIKVR